MKTIFYLVAIVLMFQSCNNTDKSWDYVDYEGSFTARHECSFVESNNQFYLLGGRRINPVNVYNPETNAWTEKGKTPIEIHHFQAINYNNKIYVVGAQTGGFPYEKPIPNIYLYDGLNDEWEVGPEIPKEIQRGGSGLAIYKDHFYLVGGIVNGHYDGHSKRFDQYDPETNTWTQLKDAPRVRDHFHAVVINDKLYAIGGRKTSFATNELFSLTTDSIDVYDLKNKEWSTLNTTLPVPRAGCMAMAIDNKLLVLGGESGLQDSAHREVSVLNTETFQWEVFPDLNTGRHGTQMVKYKNQLFVPGGCGKRGGEPELTTMEVIALD